MRVGVCGIACEVCPRRRQGTCPSGEEGCRPHENAFCEPAACACRKGKALCFDCEEFPCDLLRDKGPVAYELYLFLAGKVE